MTLPWVPSYMKSSQRGMQDWYPDVPKRVFEPTIWRINLEHQEGIRSIPNTIDDV